MRRINKYKNEDEVYYVCRYFRSKAPKHPKTVYKRFMVKYFTENLKKEKSLVGTLNLNSLVNMQVSFNKHTLGGGVIYTMIVKNNGKPKKLIVLLKKSDRWQRVGTSRNNYNLLNALDDVYRESNNRRFEIYPDRIYQLDG